MVRACSVIPDAELSEVAFRPKLPTTSQTIKILNSPIQGFDRRLSCNGRAVEDIPPTKAGGGGASP